MTCRAPNEIQPFTAGTRPDILVEPESSTLALDLDLCASNKGPAVHAILTTPRPLFRWVDVDWLVIT
jgi:hypothetical protein